MTTKIQSWRLFWLLVGVISVAVCLGLPGVDFKSDRAVETLIVRTILCALPCLLAAFTASSLVRLWPRRGTRWLLANRRYIGLAFAAGMTWHFTFVGYFFWAFGNRLAPRDLGLDVIGLLFLIAMTITSFSRFRKKLTPRNWRRLHTAGIYTLWFLPTFFFFDDFLQRRDLFDGAAVGILLAVLVLRLAGRVRVTKPVSVAQAS
jgi:DMSO/TMAO reductase YedYZ heme-binding membrane subunit